MADPAVEAAQRATANMPTLTESMSTQPILEALVSDVASAAAREALNPIRDMHRPVDYINRQRVCVTCWDSNGKPKLWPCDTSKFIYTTEELGNG